MGPAGGVSVWRDALVWAGSSGLTLAPDEPVPLALAPALDLYRKRAPASLHAAGRPWRVVFTSPSKSVLNLHG
jgi:hypothetical protein